jgi:hypothetical protein
MESIQNIPFSSTVFNMPKTKRKIFCTVPRSLSLKGFPCFGSTIADFTASDKEMVSGGHH